VETTIEAVKLCKSYGGVRAVENVSLRVGRGEVFGLLGANGAGKSTAVECILGTRLQDSGTATILGMDPRKDRKSLFARVGVPFPESSCQDKIRVAELCAVTASCTGRRVLGGLLKQFGTGGQMEKPGQRAFGRQKQRLFHRPGLIPDPEAVFLAS
jgi:ABC-2 type transport system ATP-binding protein